jgi:hypothetical protein
VNPCVNFAAALAAVSNRVRPANCEWLAMGANACALMKNNLAMY